MGPQEDYIEMVLTCEGDFYDPNFHVHLEDFSNRLQDLIAGGQRKLVLKKVEPWNSVRVTFNIPKDAAVRLKQLAEQGSQGLRELGVLAVQIEGDRVISLMIANKDNETTHLVFRTSEPESTAASSAAGSAYNASNTRNVPPSGANCVHNAVTHDEIEQYLKQQGVVNTGFFDSIFNQLGAGPGFPSPNVVAPPHEPLPFVQNRNKRLQGDRHNSAGPESFTFAPAKRGMGHALMPTNVNPPGFVAACSSATFMAALPSVVPPANVAPGQPHASFPSSLSHSQPLRHMGPKYSTSPPSTSTPGSPMPPSGAHFPHLHNPHQLAGNPNAVNVPRIMVMPQMSKGITSSSPLLVNLLQSDAAGHFNHISMSQQLQHQQQQLKIRPPFDNTSPAKRKSRKTKKQRDGWTKGSRAEQGGIADQDVTKQLTSIYSALAQNRVPSVHPDFDVHSSHFVPPQPKLMEPTAATIAAMQTSATSIESVMASISQQVARHNIGTSSFTPDNAAVTHQTPQCETMTTATTEQIVNPYTGQLEPIDTNPDSCDDGDAAKQGVSDVTSHAVPLECLRPPPNPLVALHECMHKEAEVQPPLGVLNRTVNLAAVSSAAHSAEAPPTSRNITVMNTPGTSMGGAKWTDSQAQQQPTASFGVGPALQLRGPQIVFPPGMSTEARIEHLLRSANMSRAASTDTAPPPYNVAAGKTPRFTTSAAVTSLEQAFGSNNSAMFPAGPAQTFPVLLPQQHVSGIPMASSAVGSISSAYNATAMQSMQAVNVPQGVYSVCVPNVVNPTVDMSYNLPQTASEFLSSFVPRTSLVEASSHPSAAGKTPPSFTQAALNSMANTVETCSMFGTVNRTTMSPCVNSTLSNAAPCVMETNAVVSTDQTGPMSTGTTFQSQCEPSISGVPPACAYDLTNGAITTACTAVPPMSVMPLAARTQSQFISSVIASTLSTQQRDSGNSEHVSCVRGSVSNTTDVVPSSSLPPHRVHMGAVVTTTNMSPMSTITASGQRLATSCLHPDLTTTTVSSSEVTDDVQHRGNVNSTVTDSHSSHDEKPLRRQKSSSQPTSTVHSAYPRTLSGTRSHADVLKLEGNMQMEQRVVAQSLGSSTTEHGSTVNASDRLLQPSLVVQHLNHDSDLSSQSACDNDSSSSTTPRPVENYHESLAAQGSNGEPMLRHMADTEAQRSALIKTGDDVITVGFAAVDLSSAVLSEKLPLGISDGDIVPCLSKPLMPLKREQGVVLPKTCLAGKLLLKNPDVRCAQSGHNSFVINGDDPAMTPESPGRAYVNRKDSMCIGASSTTGIGGDRTTAVSPMVSHCETISVPLASNGPSRDAGLSRRQMSHSTFSESPQRQEVGRNDDKASGHLLQRTPMTASTATKQDLLRQNSITAVHIPSSAGDSAAMSLVCALPPRLHEGQGDMEPWPVAGGVANLSRYSDTAPQRCTLAYNTSTVASNSARCTGNSGFMNRLASLPDQSVLHQFDAVTSSARDVGVLPMNLSRCSYTARETSTTMSNPSPAAFCSSPLSFLQQSTPTVGTTLVSAVSETRLYHHHEPALSSNAMNAKAALAMSKHLTSHVDSTSSHSVYNTSLNYGANASMANDQVSASTQNAVGSVSEGYTSSGCVSDESLKGHSVDQLLQKCIDESFSKDVSDYMSEKDISQVHATLADKLKQRNRKNQSVFGVQRSDSVVYNVENLKQANAASPTVNNLQPSLAASTSLSTLFPHNSPYYSSNFLNMSLHTPTRVNSVQHPITAPSFPLNLTQSVLKVVKAIPCTDTTPPPSPKPAKVVNEPSTRSRPLPLSHSVSQPTPVEKLQSSRPVVHMETLGEIKSVVIENRSHVNDRVVKVEKLPEAKMNELKAAAVAKLEVASAVGGQAECLDAEHLFTDKPSRLKGSDEKPSSPSAFNKVSTSERVEPKHALATKLNTKKQNMAVAIATINAEKHVNAGGSSHTNYNDVISNGMIDELDDAESHLHCIENAEGTAHDLSLSAKVGRGVKRKASGELSSVTHDGPLSSACDKIGLEMLQTQQLPDDNHVVEAVMARRHSYESTESHSSNPDGCGGTRWKNSLSESSEASSMTDSVSSEVRCLRGGAGHSRSGGSADRCESPTSHVTRISTRSSTRKKQPTVEANDTTEAHIEGNVASTPLHKHARGTKRKCITTELNDSDKKEPDVKNKVSSVASDSDSSGRPKSLPHVNKNLAVLDDKVVALSSVKVRKHHADSVMIDNTDVPNSAGDHDRADIPSEVAKKTRAAKPGSTKSIEEELVVVCDAKDVDKATKQVNARVKGGKADVKEPPHDDQPACKRATRSSKAKVDHCELPSLASKRRRPVKEHR